MKVAILTIGNEILSGKIINTNAAYIASSIYNLGGTVTHIVTVADDGKEIKNALAYLISESDVIITTGGLGPTSDDITKKVIASYFGKKLHSEKSVADYFKYYLHKDILNEETESQTMIPEGAECFINKVGTAPGILLNDVGTLLFMLPGVPGEMKFLLNEWVLPYIKKHFHINENVTFNFRTSTIPEVKIFDRLKHLTDNREMSYLGFYPSYGIVDIRVSGKKSDIDTLKGLKSKIKGEFKDFIFEEGNRPLKEVLGEKLKTEGMTLSVAESVTGGLIEKRLTDIPGSSLYFLGGVVTYGNYSKMKLLNVRESTLNKYGAVSEKTCYEMLKGVGALFNSDCSIAVTGIAGPSGGSKNKPVGLVYIGIKVFDKLTIKSYNFSGNRSMIRESVCNYSMFLLLRLLESSH